MSDGCKTGRAMTGDKDSLCIWWTMKKADLRRALRAFRVDQGKIREGRSVITDGVCGGRTDPEG